MGKKGDMSVPPPGVSRDHYECTRPADDCESARARGLGTDRLACCGHLLLGLLPRPAVDPVGSSSSAKTSAAALKL